MDPPFLAVVGGGWYQQCFKRSADSDEGQNLTLRCGHSGEQRKRAARRAHNFFIAKQGESQTCWYWLLELAFDNANIYHTRLDFSHSLCIAQHTDDAGVEACL